MSNNTNTLFWVITGAVIVLGVFLLVNTNQNSSLSNINNKFDSLFTGKKYEEVKSEDYSEYFENDRLIYDDYKKVDACGLKTEIVDGYKVGIHDYNDKGDEGTIIRWIIQNTNDTTSNKDIHLEFRNCETEEVLNTAYWPLDDIEPNETISLWTWGDSPNKDYQYYIKVRLEDKYVYNG